MRGYLIALALCFLASLMWLAGARAEEPAAGPAAENEVIRKGIGYVEGKSLAWLRARKCASCHHVSWMVWVQRDARARGFKIDEPGLKEATDFLLATDNRAAVAPKAGEPDRPGNPYSLLAVSTILAFREGGGAPEPAALETIQKAQAHLLAKQEADGSWKGFLGRPPIMDVQEPATLLADYGLGPQKKGDPPATERMRTREWLTANSKGESQQALSLRILTDHERKASVAELLKRQKADGGWSQTQEMASDAFATGQATYALVSRGGVRRDAPAILRAREFLRKTQQADGSWVMTSRPPNVDPTKPGAGNLEPITVTASAWAVLGLLQCHPPETGPREPSP